MYGLTLTVFNSTSTSTEDQKIGHFFAASFERKIYFHVLKQLSVYAITAVSYMIVPYVGGKQCVLSEGIFLLRIYCFKILNLHHFE
jgi:hypothetical protein